MGNVTLIQGDDVENNKKQKIGGKTTGTPVNKPVNIFNHIP